MKKRICLDEISFECGISIELAEKISESLSFMKACGITPSNTLQLRETEFYTSHEGLLLNYEEALTRKDTITEEKGWFATSAHMLWIGDRTRDLDGAHVEYMKGIANPIGLKCGPSTDPDELLKLVETLNPTNSFGRLTLIARMGAYQVREKLSPLVKAIKKSGLAVGWCCDPMHGNTIKASNGYKTRKVDDIMEEVKGFFEVHFDNSTIPGGVHFEMTGQNVTECVGGIRDIKESDLHLKYETSCDPRLNHEQSIELAFLITDLANRSFGKQVAQKIVYIGFIIGILFTLVFSTNFTDLISIRIAIGSGTAFIIAQLLDVKIFDQLRQKKWFIAPLTSSLIGSTVDTFLFFSISFYGTGIPWVTLSLGDLAVKILVALIMLIPFRLLLGTLKTV